MNNFAGIIAEDNLGTDTKAAGFQSSKVSSLSVWIAIAVVQEVIDHAVVIELREVRGKFLIQAAKHSDGFSNSSSGEGDLTFSIFGPSCADVVADFSKILEQTKDSKRDLFIRGFKLVCVLDL